MLASARVLLVFVRVLRHVVPAPRMHHQRPGIRVVIDQVALNRDGTLARLLLRLKSLRLPLIGFASGCLFFRLRLNYGGLHPKNQDGDDWPPTKSAFASCFSPEFKFTMIFLLKVQNRIYHDFAPAPDKTSQEASGEQPTELLATSDACKLTSSQ